MWSVDDKEHAGATPIVTLKMVTLLWNHPYPHVTVTSYSIHKRSNLIACEVEDWLDEWFYLKE